METAQCRSVASWKKPVTEVREVTEQTEMKATNRNHQPQATATYSNIRQHSATSRFTMWFHTQPAVCSICSLPPEKADWLQPTFQRVSKSFCVHTAMRVVLIMGLSLVWRRSVQATEQIFPHVQPFHRWVVILVASCSLLLCCPLVQRWISTWVSRCFDGWAAVGEHIIYACNYDYVAMSDNIIQNSDLLCFFLIYFIQFYKSQHFCVAQLNAFGPWLWPEVALAFVFIAPGSHSAGNIRISWHLHVIPCVQKTEFWISAKLNRGYLCRKASQGIRQAFILGSAIRVGNSKPN